MNEELQRRLADIRAIEFGDDTVEIASTLNLVLTFYEADDEPEIIGACKAKLEEGVARLEVLGQNELAQEYAVN